MKTSILVVDESDHDRGSTRAALAPVESDVTFARAGSEAESILARQRFTVVVLDLSMPGGLATARTVRATGEHRETPMLVTSATPISDDAIVELCELGAAIVLHKPVVPQLLRAGVALLLRSEQLADAAREARLVEEADAAVRRSNALFAGIVGHDLRNPLAAIVSASQLLLARDARPGDVAPLRRIAASAGRMARMIDQLLDFTRARSGGGLPCEPEHVDFAPIARAVVDELRVAHRGREIVLDERGTLVGFWDGDRLAQLLSNLVSNALQHGSDREPVRVRLDGTAPDGIVLSVSSRGVIPAELVPVVFEPFRGTSYKRHRSAGLGLGLFIAQQIARLHGGTIDLDASDREHTTLTVRLPR